MDGGIRLGHRAKELEETAEAADAEEGELGASVAEACPQSEGNLPVDSLVGQGADQILNHHSRRRLIGSLRRRGGGPFHRLAPERLLQVHLLRCRAQVLLSGLRRKITENKGGISRKKKITTKHSLFLFFFFLKLKLFQIYLIFYGKSA